MTDVENLLVNPNATIREAMTRIDRGTNGIALVVDESRCLIGTITDGDVRRAILAGVNLEEPVEQLLSRKASPLYAKPITAPVGAERDVLLRLMQEHRVRQVPLVDDQGGIAGLAMLDELLPDQVLPLQAVVMAGGMGTRLRPLTDNLPKPMLPIGDRPLLQLIIEQLRRAGIRQVNITTHFQPEKITNYFGDGRAFGVDLAYVSEDRPLGTAGALGLMEPSNEPLLVINGDILTRVDFRAMLAHHRQHEADLTVGVRQYSVQVPYGVVECEGTRVRQMHEKPVLNFLVNAGIYLLEPIAHRYVPNNGQHFDMPDLIQSLVDDGRKVVSFPIVEYWLDIGRLADYEQAQVDFGREVAS